MQDFANCDEKSRPDVKILFNSESFFFHFVFNE